MTEKVKEPQAQNGVVLDADEIRLLLLLLSNPQVCGLLTDASVKQVAANAQAKLAQLVPDE